MSTVCPPVYRQTTPPNKRLSTFVTAEWPLARVHSLMNYHTTCFVRGVLARLTLVPAVTADVAVTVLHVLLQTILSQTCVVAVGAMEHAFTWGTRGCSVVSHQADGYPTDTSAGFIHNYILKTEVWLIL